MAIVTILDVIRTKRDGAALSDEQIRWFIEQFTARTIADEQAASLLMAIVWRGLDARELATWTASVIRRWAIAPIGSAAGSRGATRGHHPVPCVDQDDRDIARCIKDGKRVYDDDRRVTE